MRGKTDIGTNGQLDKRNRYIIYGTRGQMDWRRKNRKTSVQGDKPDRVTKDKGLKLLYNKIL